MNGFFWEIKTVYNISFLVHRHGKDGLPYPILTDAETLEPICVSCRTEVPAKMIKIVKVINGINRN